MTTQEANFSAKDVMALRQETDMGMMDCKKALAEANRKTKKAKELLFAKKKGKMETRTERATGEGRVALIIEGPEAVIVEVRTETDFTARNDKFVTTVDELTRHAMGMPAGTIEPDDAMTRLVDQLRVTTGENVNFARGERFSGGQYGGYIHHDAKRGALVEIEGGTVDEEVLKGICQHIVFHDPKFLDESQVPADELDAVRNDAIQEAKDSGKPEEIAEKIATGKVRRFLEDNTLVNQKFILDEEKTVGSLLPEGARITRFVRYTLGS